MKPTTSLWAAPTYRINLPDLVPAHIDRVAGQVFRRVWRTTLNEPGFAVIGFDERVSSKELRRALVALAGAMTVPFVPERLGRFDQQVTSRFHRDGAPTRSLLLLGYEASPVVSRVFVADAARAATEMGLGITEFLAAHNPMFPDGEAQLGPFVTELAVPHGESYIVVINNSLLPFDTEGKNPLGVLHKAVVPYPDPIAHRVINSLGLMYADEPTGMPKSRADIEHFLTRDDLD